MRNLLTIDVEEYFQVEGMTGVIDRRDWGRLETRAAASTLRILDLLDAKHQRATFFVLGWTAERDPDLVREIARRGHEVACHGYSHRMADQLGVRAFRRDVRRAKRLLEGILGDRVLGYRAPSFSITERTPWAHRVLAEEGFAYSSSVFPVRHDRYGVPDAPRSPYEVATDAGLSLIELPPLTLRLAGVNLPAAGGGYMRLLPTAVVSHAIRRMNASGAPAVVYLHPWEIDPDQPRLPVGGLNGFRHYVGLGRMHDKLARLLDRHAFGTMADYVGLPVQRVADDERSPRSTHRPRTIRLAG